MEWFKRNDVTGNLMGFTFDEASEVKNLLTAKCRNELEKNTINIITDEDLPHQSNYSIPDNALPKYYPLEGLLVDGIIGQLPFEIIGYNRFLESK